MHRIRLSDEEIVIITKALNMLTTSMGIVRDTAEKELAWRTFERFVNKKDGWHRRPRAQLYHKELVERFKEQ